MLGEKACKMETCRKNMKKKKIIEEAGKEKFKKIGSTKRKRLISFFSCPCLFIGVSEMSFILSFGFLYFPTEPKDLLFPPQFLIYFFFHPSSSFFAFILFNIFSLHFFRRHLFFAFLIASLIIN